MKTSIFFLALFSTFQVFGQRDYPSSTWRQYVDNCLIGFVDPEGNVMIEAQFENATDFSEGLAFVWSYPGKERDLESIKLGEKYVNYEFIGSEGNRRTGIIDTTGNYVLEPKVNFHSYRAFENGFALVSIDRQLQLIDRRGEVVTHRFQSYFEAKSNDVLIPARYNDEIPMQKCYVNSNRSFMYGPFQECQYFSEGFGAVRIFGKYGYINTKGDLSIVPQFYSAGQFSEGYATVSVRLEQEVGAKVYYGVVDTTGNFVVQPEYEWLGNVSEGLVTFAKTIEGERKYGFLDLNGNVVIDTQFDHAGSFGDNLAPVTKKEKVGYVDKSGKVVIDFRYQWGQSFRNGVALVRIKKNKMGLINSDGKLIVGPWKSECN